jgi:hypothetical protein
MGDETLKAFRRLVRQVKNELAAEKAPAKRAELERTLAARRLDLERYQRGFKRTGTGLTVGVGR